MGYRRKAFQEALRPGRRWRPRRARRSAARQVARQAHRLPYHSRETLLSRGEAAFFGPLQAAVGSGYLIMCKVRLADVVTCPVRQDQRGPFSAISQKHLDFILCDPRTTRFVLAIELDDRSHEQDHRKRRDTFVNDVLRAAGIPLLRLRAASRYSVIETRERINTVLDGPAQYPRSFQSALADGNHP